MNPFEKSLKSEMPKLKSKTFDISPKQQNTEKQVLSYDVGKDKNGNWVCPNCETINQENYCEVCQFSLLEFNKIKEEASKDEFNSPEYDWIENTADTFDKLFLRELYRFEQKFFPNGYEQNTIDSPFQNWYQSFKQDNQYLLKHQLEEKIKQAIKEKLYAYLFKSLEAYLKTKDGQELNKFILTKWESKEVVNKITNELERLLKEGADKNNVAWGLAGVGTPESMALRERLLKEGADKNNVACGLAGVGSPESMALRERLLKEGADKNNVAWGLAGVNTSEGFDFRNKFFSDNPTTEALSFSTGRTVIDGVICRYGYESGF